MPNLLQVASVYGWFAVVLASGTLAYQTDTWWTGVPAFAMIGVPWLLRRRAIKRMLKANERAQMGMSTSTT